MEAKGPGYGKRILCIEDDPSVSSLIKTVLTLEGYEVLEAAKGTVGLDLLYRTFPHAVLLDLRMPVLGGLGILDILKEKSGLREVRVVCITAATDEASMYRALCRGADAYLFKPVEFEFLRLVLRYLLEERERAARARELAAFGRAAELLELMGREVDLLPKLEALLLLASGKRMSAEEMAGRMACEGADLGGALEEMVEQGILAREEGGLAVSSTWADRARSLASLVSEYRGLELAANLVHMGVGRFL